MRYILGLVGVALLTLGVSGHRPQAAEYPVRPIRVVVPSAAGGTTDIIARLLGDRVSALLGQRLVVENQAGANGIVGTNYVARQPNDGYTIMVTFSGHAINPIVSQKPSYDAEKDFTPLILISTVPLALTARPRLAGASTSDLIELARRSAVPLTYGSGGHGSSNQLATELFAKQVSIKLVHVPFRGNSPTINALVGEQIDFSFINVPDVVPYFEAGTLRVLAVTSPKGVTVLPGVPTLADTVPGYTAGSWHAVFGPANLPPEILSRLNQAFQGALDTPEIRSKMTAMGFDVAGGTPETFADFLRVEVAKWTKVAREAGIKAD